MTQAGHGTHTAGSAAGATLSVPAETITCSGDETLSCVGACIDESESTDDLVSYYLQLALPDLDRLCPMYGCDILTDPCLSDEVDETLSNNGGMAQGAKLSIFDVFFEVFGLIDSLGNGVWDPCQEAGCKIHSLSLGGDTLCTTGESEILYDEFMYEV